jgi:prophage DNA circulation protein
MPNTKFDLKLDLKQLDLPVDLDAVRDGATKTLYAGAGVADLAVETLREYVAEAQKKFAGVQKDVTTRVEDVQKRATKLDLQPQALREHATTVVNARVEAISKDAKARRTAIEARVSELQAEAKAYPGKVQALVNENVETAGGTYDDLVKRGEVLVARIRRQESTKATKETATTAKKSAKSTAKKASAKKAAPKKSAKATTTAAKKTAESAARATTDAAAKIGD